MGDLSDVYGGGARGGAAAFDPANPARQAINPPSLFDGSALFSQIIVAPLGRAVAIAGLIGVTAENRLVAGGKPAQIAQTFANLAAAIAASGGMPGDCVRLREYIVDYAEADIAPLRDAIAALFPAGALPTNTVVPVPRLGRDGALIEIEADLILPR